MPVPDALPPAAQSALWARLVALELDGPAALSFSQRLARDNGWPPAFARRVVLEYKKFVYLAATCGHPVTPSDEVDQAWHLHLVYTRSYWEELCGQVLGFALHHGPTKGGAAEGAKFRDWYAATQQAYRAAFGEVPPPDIWPAAAVRFGEAPHFRRVNLRRHWLLPRPALAGLRWPTWAGLRGKLALPWRPALPARPGRWGLALAAGLVLVGCTARTSLNPFNWYGPEFLGLFWGVYALLMVGALWLRSQGSGPFEAYAGPALSTYEVVRLAGQGSRLPDSALAALAHAHYIELVPDRKIRRTGPTPPPDPYERAVWTLVVAPGSTPVDTVRTRAVQQIFGAVRNLDQSLQAKGLLLSAEARRRLNYYPLGVTLVAEVFGLIKVGVGLHRDRPVGFLIISLLLLCLLLGIALNYGAWATGRGKYVLQQLARRTKEGQSTGVLTTQTVALTVAFFGLGALSSVGLDSLATHLAPPSSSDGGGSSDGGSGCGGGGCGGCGS